MRIWIIVRGLVALVCVAVGLVVFAPISPATPLGSTDTAGLTAAGIDIGKLRPGWSIVGEQVVWDGGDITLSVGPQSPSDCPIDRICLFDNNNFTGMLALRGAGWHNLAWYGFDNKMSAWYNRTIVDARWYYNNPFVNPYPNRCMPPGTLDWYTQGLDPENDQASFLFIFDNANGC